MLAKFGALGGALLMTGGREVMLSAGSLGRPGSGKGRYTLKTLGAPSPGPHRDLPFYDSTTAQSG